MFDFEEALNQARNFQQKMKEDLQKMAVEGSSGGGDVKVIVNGSKEITKIEFTERALQDPDMLADLVLAAVSGAYAQVDKELENQTPNLANLDLSNLDLSSLGDMFKK